MGSQKKSRLAYLVSHPIQYQAPLLRRIAAQPGIELVVLFQSDFSTRSYEDPGFECAVDWDVPLLEGFEYEVLPGWGQDGPPSFWRPWNRSVRAALAPYAPNARGEGVAVDSGVPEQPVGWAEIARGAAGFRSPAERSPASMRSSR